MKPLARQRPLTPHCSLHAVLPTLACSVELNKFGAEGAKHWADMLKVNTTLLSVKCAACCPIPSCCEPFTPSRPTDALLTPWDAVCSVSRNKFGPEGAKYFSDMLLVNTTLQSVEYAAKLAKL